MSAWEAWGRAVNDRINDKNRSPLAAKAGSRFVVDVVGLWG
jgi:hypothetical protein